MLDVTSYIIGEDFVYVHRVCRETFCEFPSVGPLKSVDGRLRRDAIQPLRRCLAKDRTVPCPARPLETIKAMAHSALKPNCIALPDKALQNSTQKSSLQSGLSLEDVEILKRRSEELDRRGFQSMTPYFQACDAATWNALRKAMKRRASIEFQKELKTIKIV